MLGIQNDREWRAFCKEVIDCAELADDPRFTSNTDRSASRAALEEIIAGAFSKLTGEELIEKLDRASIANAHVNGIADVWGHRQLIERKRWVEVDSSVGKIPALLPAGVPAEFSPRMGPIPTVGQHNESIRSELAGHALSKAEAAVAMDEIVQGGR
jgi:crotonobetainyl-CoA:carnitine CoA-transferase CaiB-like acyl-CoA transferase